MRLLDKHSDLAKSHRFDDALNRSPEHWFDVRALMPDTSGAGAGPGPPLNAPAPGLKASQRSVTFSDSQGIVGTASQPTWPSQETLVDGDGDSPGNGIQIPGGTKPDDGPHQGTEPKEVDPADTQKQLNRYRECLARDMERREVSARGGNLPTNATMISPPAAQDETNISPASSSEQTSTSTGSGNTLRGGTVPGLPTGNSYSFPHMTTPGSGHPPGHLSYNTLSSATLPPACHNVPFEDPRLHGKVLPDRSAPSSTMSFPADRYAQAGALCELPSPNLYDLTLMLSAEPGLDAWWNTVVQIMTDVYKAERITLAIPADSTDIENVPWGQKATYNPHQDDLSIGYLARGSSFNVSSNDGFSEAKSQADEPAKQKGAIRPGLQSRHSFTSYEDKKKTTARERSSANRRPNLPSRSKSSYPASSLRQEEASEDGDDDGDGGEDQLQGLNRKALEEHDALEGQQDIASWDAPFASPGQDRGKVLNVLQALDYEADPLIDHNGVMRVLERGRVIALTRNYPYLNPNSKENPSESNPASQNQLFPEAMRKRVGKYRPESVSGILPQFESSNPISSGRGMKSQAGEKKKAAGIAAKIEHEDPLPPMPKFEEFEQAPPSPWSQSPAPSPAVRADPTENPFFTDAMVDEESFNPSSGPEDYSTMVPPEAIGVDNSWTVLHIPLTHVLLSKLNPSFKLDNTLLEQKYAKGTSESRTEESGGSAAPQLSPLEQKQAPIAILSILSPIIPYPSNLRQSLDQLAPHLATSFSLCRHYTNLEVELNGLQKRRPHPSGFGAVGHDGRILADPTALATLGYMPSEDPMSRDPLGGSITSPSDYSAPSRGTIGSPFDTPCWDPAALGFVMDNRLSASSPAPASGDSYFNTKPKSGSSSTPQPMGRNSKESSSAEKKSLLRNASGKTQLHIPVIPGPAVSDGQAGGDGDGGGGRHSDERPPSAGIPRSHQRSTSATIDTKEQTGAKDEAPQNGSGRAVAGEAQKRTAISTPTSQRRHTQLHSYGADFATTFQSLPPSSMIGSKPISRPAASSRGGSVAAAQPEMTPPSDRLKSLILDSLPAHVFVALPQTGEILWVNSRFLTYRGQTSGDLAADPWGSIHPDDREEYLRAWSHSVRSGEQFSRTVRIRRFDGAYRWFYARAVASKDKRGVIIQFLGSYMDIHDQHIAELRAARKEEIEASEAKHRLLANLIPQIIFTATEDEGITFANEQWLSYTGQTFDDALGLGFMDYVHPEDLAKCRIPIDRPPTPMPQGELRGEARPPPTPSGPSASAAVPVNAYANPESNMRGVHQALSRNNSSSSGSVYELPTANLTELAKQGVIKVATDSNGRLSYTTEIRLRSKVDEYRWHLIRCVEIDNVDFGNGASSYFGSATDINDHKLLEAKLKEAMESKGRFLSNMSHEIRTPLVGISGMVSFLQDTTLNEEQRDYTNTIQTSANSLLMIINDILDLSKVDAGMMKLSHEWFHTRSLIEDVNELVSTMAIAKRLELNYVVEEDVPAWVKGDRVRIRQILLNVIGNAIKFTSQGEVFSMCKVFTPEDESLRDDEIMLQFSIVDTGRGFTEKEAELIFKPFSQIDGSSTRQYGGSGLGLVISRQLVELHGGRMDGTAVPGKGSTFTFTARFGLPTDLDHPEAPSSPRGEQAPKTPHDDIPRDFKHFPSNRVIRQSPATTSPSTDPEFVSPTLTSSSCSDPSVNSGRTQTTGRSSMSPVNAGLVRFSAAARASGQDLSQMKLEMPSERTASEAAHFTGALQPPGIVGDFRPLMYSILIICPQSHSREATTKHIEMTLPKDIPHQITALSSIEESKAFTGGDDPVMFTHIVVNLPSPEEIIALMDQVVKSGMVGKTTILILTDSVQRQAVTKLVANTRYEELLSEKEVTYIYKPVKPSRFAVIFDPGKERDLSIDRNRSTAQRIVEHQKQSYIEVEKRMGNKGYKVLVVEDNLVNQKVLQKYLKKVGVQVEVAADGAECTEKVFSQPHGCYSLILVGRNLGPPPTPPFSLSPCGPG